MASTLDLVKILIEEDDGIPFADAEDQLKVVTLRAVNQARKYVYNAGDLSFKCRLLDGYVYDPSDTNSVPDDFLGFHKTGKLWITDYNPPKELIYQRAEKIIQWKLGIYSNRVQAPRFYGILGPLNGLSNKRDIVLGPTPPDVVTLRMVYQAKPPVDATQNDWTDDIIIIPDPWHETTLLEMARVFRNMKKGMSNKQQNALLQSAFQQMNTQEPHGREAPTRLPPHPAWERR